MVKKTPLQRAIAKAGSQAALARLTGISQPNFSRWLKAGRPVPAEAAIAIEKAVGVSRTELRPDLWPAEDAAA